MFCMPCFTGNTDQPADKQNIGKPGLFSITVLVLPEFLVLMLSTVYSHTEFPAH